MRISLAASILIVAGAAHAAVTPDFQKPALEEIADRMHVLAVEVVASGGDEKVNFVSGVLAGDGIVLTDLRALLVQAPGGILEPSSEIVVLTAKGVFPARIIGAALDVDVAVLELAQAGHGLEGAPLAEKPTASGDSLLAIRAANQGTSLLFEVISFSIEQAEGDAHRLQATPAVPNTFAGAPVFDADGALAGLLVSPREQDGLLVTAARLRQILTRARAAVPQVDDHI
jgi:Trypsin-like peptidase domain